MARLLLLLLPGIFVPSCETHEGPIIPYVRVDEYLLLYADLANMGIGSSKVIPGGWQGIVIYREADLVFQAYDRTCTLYPLHNEAVVEDSVFQGVYICPDCGSSYLLMNGAEPNSGPARDHLVQYNTSIQRDVLHIYN